jgi:hypothetical protein
MIWKLQAGFTFEQRQWGLFGYLPQQQLKEGLRWR